MPSESFKDPTTCFFAALFAYLQPLLHTEGLQSYTGTHGAAEKRTGPCSMIKKHDPLFGTTDASSTLGRTRDGTIALFDERLEPTTSKILSPMP